MTGKGIQKGQSQDKWTKQGPERSTFTKENLGDFIENVKEAMKKDSMWCHKVLKANKVEPPTTEAAVTASQAGDKAIKTQEANQTPGDGDDAVL